MNSTINDMLNCIQANLSEEDKAIRLTHQLTYGKENGLCCSCNAICSEGLNLLDV